MDEKTIEAIAAQLRKPAGEYAEEIAARMNISNRQINQFCIEVLPLKKNDRILEIGMGNGHLLEDLFQVEEQLYYTGCDYSPEMIAAAKQFNSKRVLEGKAQYIEGNILQLPFDEGVFDGIFTVNTLYFWDDYENAFSELKRVMKSDACLSIGIRPEFSMKAYPFVKYGFRLFNRSDLETVLIANGFKVLRVIEKEEAPRAIGDEMLNVDSLVVLAQKA